MNPKASLEELVEYFGTPQETRCFYFDRQTGEVVDVEKPMMKAVAEGNHGADLPDDGLNKAEIVREILNDKSNRFVQLPDNSQCNGDRLKTGFIGTLRDQRIAAKLARTMKRDTFRFFRFTTFATVVYRLRLDDDWHKYRVEVLKRFAIEYGLKPIVYCMKMILRRLKPRPKRQFIKDGRPMLQLTGGISFNRLLRSPHAGRLSHR